MILNAKGLCKSFDGLPVLSGVDLTILKNSSVAIQGRSGEGKTTLLHILGGLEDFDEGKLEVLGEDIRKTPIAKLRSESFGFIFQNYNLLYDFTLLENIVMPARIARRRINRAHLHYIEELLEQVGLQDRKHFPVKYLSGGEKQRAAIARALCNKPDILFADEPTGNLDFENGEIIHKLLLDMVRLYQKTLLLVTHEESFARSCDQCYTLSKNILTCEF